MTGQSHHKRKSNKSGHLLRMEPSTADLFEVFPQVAEVFDRAGWLNFCLCLKGYHPEIVSEFVKTFDGYEAQVAELTVRISEDIIACVFDIQIEGERWFRKDKFDESSLQQFLKEECPEPNWSIGIPTKYLKDEYKMMMIAIRGYITCEGRYVHLYRLHMRFLLHLTGQQIMNLPYFLIKDLTKISKKIQQNPSKMENSVSHHSLITMLVFDQLRRDDMSIKKFLQGSGFAQKEQLESMLDRRSKTKKAAFTLLPIPEQEETECSAPIKEETYEQVDEMQADYEGIKTRSKTKLQQASQEMKSSSVTIEDEGEEEQLEKQSIPVQQTRKRFTRATNKFRLNAKAMLDPSLKSKEPIDVEEELDLPSKSKKKTSKAKTVKQSSSADLLVQLADIAEFLETKSAEGMLEEAQAILSDQSKEKTSKAATGKKPRRSKKKLC